MTSKEFNEKYKEYLESNFYGNVVNNESVNKYLDKEFEKAIKEFPSFKYYQIKWKWDDVRVYTNVGDLDTKWELEITKILNNENS